jgi:hypothetical protein
MDPNPLRTLQTTVRLAKQDKVNQHGVGTDLPRTLMTFAGTQPIGEYVEEHDDRLFYATSVAAIALSDCDRAVFVSEHYVEVVDAYLDITPADVERHDLARRFASGDPAVKEAVAITVVPRHGPPWVTWNVYRYEGKRVAWEEKTPHPVMSERLVQQGRLLADEGYAQQAQRPGPAVMTPGTQLLVAGKQECEHGLMVAFAISLPCPCHSGKPINECCAQHN